MSLELAAQLGFSHGMSEKRPYIPHQLSDQPAVVGVVSSLQFLRQLSDSRQRPREVSETQVGSTVPIDWILHVPCEIGASRLESNFLHVQVAPKLFERYPWAIVVDGSGCVTL